MPATVAAVEYLGADTLIDTRIADQSFTVRVGGHASAAAGDTVHIGWDAAARALVRSVVRMSYRSLKQKHHPREKHHGPQRIPRRHRCARRLARWPRPRWRRASPKCSFFYPIAVGGPITKIIDGYAADFEKANPSIKVKPIYSGTYQESITKALTAHKSGTPPVTSVLLSTDMFTLIDEDAIVPIDGFIKTDDDKKWLASFFPAFMENSRTPGKTWGVPFQRSTIVLYYNKDAFKEAGLDPEKAPANWEEMQAFAEKLTKRDASGNTTQWGVQIPLVRLSLLAVPGADHASRRDPDERGGRPHLLRQARGDRGAAVLGRPLAQAQGSSARHRRVGHDAEGFLRAQGRDDVDHDRQSDEREGEREIPLRRRDAAGAQAPRLADRRRQFLHLEEGERRRAECGVPVHQVDHNAGARRAVEHRHRLRRRCGRMPTTPTR